MTEPIESVVKVATTPAQAKVYVALLQAAGIPARVEGDSLTDEFAASRRLMNLMGVNVMVPTATLKQARELLVPTEVDEAELTRQALAEQAADIAPAAASPARSGLQPLWLWALFALVVFFAAAAWLTDVD